MKYCLPFVRMFEKWNAVMAIIKRYWQASTADGDVVINNMLSYEGDTPLEIYEKRFIHNKR